MHKEALEDCSQGFFFLRMRTAFMGRVGKLLISRITGQVAGTALGFGSIPAFSVWSETDKILLERQTHMAKLQVNLTFRAFSDRTRLRILHLLLEGELCVGDIVAVLRMSQPKVSRHLAYLRKTGLVETRKNGLWNHYRLTSAGSAFHRKLLECLKHCFDAVPEIAADRAKERQIRRSGGCCPH